MPRPALQRNASSNEERVPWANPGRWADAGQSRPRSAPPSFSATAST